MSVHFQAAADFIHRALSQPGGRKGGERGGGVDPRTLIQSKAQDSGCGERKRLEWCDKMLRKENSSLNHLFNAVGKKKEIIPDVGRVANCPWAGRL